MEAAPRLDTSRPTRLRAAGFACIAVGAVLLGVGALATWITVGIPNESNHSVFHGTDLTEGRVVLASALIVLVTIVSSRLVRSRAARYALSAVTGIAGLTSAVVAASFIAGGKDRGVVLTALGIPRSLWTQLGVFRDLGPGPYLALAGGLACLAGAVLTLVWAHRLGSNASPEPHGFSG